MKGTRGKTRGANLERHAGSNKEANLGLKGDPAAFKSGRKGGSINNGTGPWPLYRT